MSPQPACPPSWSEGALRLFEDLGKPDLESDGPDRAVNLIETLNQEEKALDQWRIPLVFFCFETANYLSASRVHEVGEAHVIIQRLNEILNRLAAMPGHDGVVFFRFRGRGGPKARQENLQRDYVVHFGSIRLDRDSIRHTARRLGRSATHFPASFDAAMDVLADCGITTLRFSLGKWTAQEQFRMLHSVLALSDYLRLVTGLSKGQLESQCAGGDALAVLDEAGRPDPNLTCLAVMNNLPLASIQGLVNNVGLKMDRARPGSPLLRLPNVYEALFAFKKIRAALQKPMVEVNNSHWLAGAPAGQVLNPSQAMTTRHAAAVFGSASPKTARVLDGVFGTEYTDIPPHDLRERLLLSNRLLSSLGKGKKYQTVRSQILAGAQKLLHGAGLDAVASLEEEVSNMDSAIFELFRVYRQRKVTDKKIKDMVREPVVFDEADYGAVSREFEISRLQARELLDILRSCFDSRGHFLRPNFQSCVADLSLHEEKVFRLFWHFLSGYIFRKERVGFLNSMKVLADKTANRQQCVRILLSDFLRPDRVRYYDRNALMLCTMLLRKYNKELRQDIDRTPAAVIRVQRGLDEELVDFSQEFLKDKADAFLMKMRLIHQEVKNSLDAQESWGRMPARYMLTLEWEAFVFLSLTGGHLARAVLRKAFTEYANPSSELYRLRRSSENMADLLDLLGILVKGLRRFNDAGDTIALFELLSRENDFAALADSHGDRESQGWKQVRNQARAFSKELDQGSFQAWVV